MPKMTAPPNSTAVGLMENLRNANSLSPGQMVDFGINSEEHRVVLEEALCEGLITADKLWEAIQTDCDIDALVKPVNPNGLHFESIYAGMNGF